MYFSKLPEQLSNKLDKYGLYEIQNIVYNESELKQNYLRIIKPLQSFAPIINEEIFNFIPPQPDDSDLYIDDEQLEENMIPINELVQKEPETVEEFVELLKSRFRPKTGLYVTEADQFELIEICVQECKFKWKDMKRIIEDPFLSQSENLELRRRLFVNVISICEKIYHYYIKRADTLKSRQIFSYKANISRLKTLMAFDLNKFLKIHSIKYYLAHNLKTSQKLETQSIYQADNNSKKRITNLKLITTRDLIEDFRLKHLIKSKRFKTRKEHLKEIMDSMPILETKKLHKLLNSLPVRSQEVQEPEQVIEPEETILEESKNVYQTDEDLVNKLKSIYIPRVGIRRSKSSPGLHEIKLSEELNLNLNKIKQEKYKTTDFMNKFNILNAKKTNSEENRNYKINLKDKNIEELLKQDLEKLTLEFRIKNNAKEDHGEGLLMTLMSKPNFRERMKEIKAKMRAIDNKHKKFIDEISQPLIKSEQAQTQPATFDTRFFNNLPARLSDIRVSNRVLRFNITLEPYGPLFNDINGDVK